MGYLTCWIGTSLRWDAFSIFDMSGYSPNLTTTWVRYDAAVVDRLKSIHSSEKDCRTFRLYPNVNRLLFEAVEDIEKGSLFSELHAAIQSEETAKGFHKKCHQSFWEHALTNVLRRSGYYINRVGDQTGSPHSFLTNIMGHFARRDKVVTLLAPMEYVSLRIDEINCSTFSIRKFSKAELDQLFEQALCEAFFPWAVLDTAPLSEYWFIVIKDTRSTMPLGSIKCNLTDIGKITPEYSPFPVVDRALQALALIDWQPDWTRSEEKKNIAEWKGWLGFRIPFVLRYSDLLLDRPGPAPNLSLLQREPNINPWTGVEEGEKPSVAISFDDKETEEFADAARKSDQLFLLLDLPWRVGRLLAERSVFSKGILF